MTADVERTPHTWPNWTVAWCVIYFITVAIAVAEHVSNGAVFGQVAPVLQNLPEAFWTTVAGAIVGAVVAGTIGIVGQLLALRANERARAEERLRIRQSLGYSLLFKVMRIHADVLMVHRTMEGFFQNAPKQPAGHPGPEPWQIVQGFANPPENIIFTSDEMAMLLSLGDVEVLNQVLSLDRVQNGLLDSVRLMTNRIERLTEQLTPNWDNGITLGAFVANDELRRFRSLMILVNGLILSIREEARQSYGEVSIAFERLNRLLHTKLELNIRFQLPTAP